MLCMYDNKICSLSRGGRAYSGEPEGGGVLLRPKIDFGEKRNIIIKIGMREGAKEKVQHFTQKR